MPILSAVREYVRLCAEPTYDILGRECLDLGPVQIIADKSGTSFETLCNWMVKPERVGPIPFDVADKLLCACDLFSLWYGPLSDYYEAVSLRWALCAHPDCKTYFESDPRRHQQFCTRACYESNRMGNRRIKHFHGVNGSVKTHGVVRCRNGHPRTPETTITLKTGKIRCRVCNNATSAAGYHRKRAVAT